MGYYTFFQLDIPELLLDEKKEIISQLRKTNYEAQCALNDYGDTLNESEWYNYREDIKKFSKKTPHLFFILSGTGEQPDDRWKLYVQDGKHQFCKARLVFPEFNENLMEE